MCSTAWMITIALCSSAVKCIMYGNHFMGRQRTLSSGHEKMGCAGVLQSVHQVFFRTDCPNLAVAGCNSRLLAEYPAHFWNQELWCNSWFNSCYSQYKLLTCTLPGNHVVTLSGSHSFSNDGFVLFTDVYSFIDL